MPLSKFEIERRKIIRRVQNDIAKHGQSVVSIPDGEPIPFHYTVGRAGRGLPELLMIAPINPEAGMHMMNYLDKKMPVTMPNGSSVDLGGTYPVLVIDVTDIETVQDQYTCIASTLYGDAYRVQQIMLCDKEGRFPFDPACSRPYSTQPKLGSMGWKQ